MRVINISHEDYANYSYYNSEAMRSVGIDSESYCLKKHKFAYNKQATLTSSRDIVAQCERADIIQVMHSCGTMWDIVKNLKNKRIIVWHTGTRYRKNKDRHNGRWNPIVEKSMCALGEFMSLGSHNPEYFGITVPVENIPFNCSVNSVLNIGHYPSNRKVKGSEAVERVLNSLKSTGANFNYLKGPVISYPQHINRMRQVDVYIEMMAMTQGGNPYGSYGTTAIEAAAMGKIVVTNNIWESLYKEVYGNSELVIANSEKVMEDKIRNLINMPSDHLETKKIMTREWALKNHGLEAQGNRMKKVLGI